MADRTDFVKIRVWIPIDPNKHYIFEDGKIKPNLEYVEEFYNADEKWREPIITFINEEVGLHNWGIKFQPFYTGEYEVYIYCPTTADFYKIVSIIKERIDHNFILFKRNGNIDDYLANR